MARLGDYTQDERATVGDATNLQLIGVSNEHGLQPSSKKTSANISRYKLIKDNWFAYNPMRVNIGSIGIADEPSKTGFTSPDYTVFSCKKGLLPAYLLLFLKSEYGLEAIARNCSGAVRKRLYYSGLAEIELPIPCIEEQQQFIERIHQIQSVAKFIQNENSDQHELPTLKQAILQEAIQGKLTESWRAAHPDVEPASELLQRIQKEKARLIADKKIRKAPPLPAIAPEEIPFEIPEGWEWCRFGDIQLFSDSGSSPKCVERQVSGDEWGILRVSATSRADFKEDENKFFQTDQPEKLDAKVRHGDFILSRANTKELTGNSVIVEKLTKNLLLSDKTVRFNLPANELKPHYANLVNKAQFVRDHFITNATGASPSMKNLSRQSINTHPFPLPPLAEQAAIVEREDALMATCRELEAEITASKAHAEQLLQAVLKEAFSS